METPKQAITKANGYSPQLMAKTTLTHLIEDREIKLLPNSRLLTSIHGTRRKSACYQNRKVTINPGTKHATYNSNQPA